MVRIRSLLVLTTIALWPGSVGAQLDKHDSTALNQTKALMADPKARQEVISKDPAAQRADEAVKALSGNPNDVNDIYRLAGEVFEKMVQDSGGDMSKLQEKLSAFQRDPASFAASWTPEQRAHLKQIAERLKANQVPPAK